MTLELHHHPLSSYCWKVQIALYELGAPFEPVLVDLGDPQARAAYLRLSPFGKIPAVRDRETGQAFFETSIIIEELDRRFGGAGRLIPQDWERAREVRLSDRIFDLEVHNVFQQLVADRLRPEGQRDPLGVEQARGKLMRAYEVLEERLAGREWAAGGDFSLADCAAAPALFYSGLGLPVDAYPTLAAYRARLLARPSVARAIEEAKPFFHMFPATPEERARLPS